MDNTALYLNKKKKLDKYISTFKNIMGYKLSNFLNNK